MFRLNKKTILLIIGILSIASVAERQRPNSHYSPILYQLGIDCEGKCSVQARKKYNQRAVYHDPNYDDAWYQLGRIAEQEGRDEEALTFYKKVSELDFENFVASYKVGLDYFVREEFDQAFRLFQRAVRYENTLAPAYYYLARIYTEKNEYEEAIRQYQFCSNFTGDNQIDVYMRLGVLYHKLNLKSGTTLYSDKLRGLGRNELAFQLEQLVRESKIPEYFEDNKEKISFQF